MVGRYTEASVTAIAMATNLGFTNKLVFLVRKVDRRYVRRLIVDRPRAVTREKKENSLVFLRIRYSSAFPTVRARRREEGSNDQRPTETSSLVLFTATNRKTSFSLISF